MQEKLKLTLKFHTNVQGVTSSSRCEDVVAVYEMIFSLKLDRFEVKNRLFK